jgi:hypothetical protein
VPRHPAFAHLPEALRVLLPEMETLAWPEESHADCAHCTMADGTFGTWGFHASTRCCTAQPSLANYLVGGALRRGGVSREKILARLENLEGVSVLGIDPPPAADERYQATMATQFGRDTEMRCPYYVGGELTCGIWHDRAAMCRTWFCKHEDGLAGAVSWSRMFAVLSDLEMKLALWAIGEGAAESPDEPAPCDAWVAWFERCAEIVENASVKDLGPLATEALGRRRREVTGYVQIRLARRKPLPDVLVPSVTERARQANGDWLLTGYSSFDAVRAPAAVFELLARLDGTRTWREALDLTRADLEKRTLDTAWLDERLIRELHRVMALRDPGGGDDLPYSVEMADMDRWSRAAEAEKDKK